MPSSSTTPPGPSSRRHGRRCFESALATLMAALTLSALTTSCISGRRPIVLDSTPRGAVVLLDGETTGHSTPCTIQLPTKRRTIEFQLEGYRTESREIRTGERSEVVYWRDATTPTGNWAFPLFLPTRDFLFPIMEDDGEFPARIHVRMTREREPLAQLR